MQGCVAKNGIDCKAAVGWSDIPHAAVDESISNLMGIKLDGRTLASGNMAKRAVRNLGDMVGEEVAMTVQVCGWAVCTDMAYG